MDLRDLKIIFFGTPEFAVASLKALIDNGACIKAVVTAPDKPAGRGHKLLKSDIKIFAEEKGILILQPRNLKSPEFIAQLKELNADLFVVIAFRMLPEAVWSMPRFGSFNLHASLLPKYRGAAPINRAVMNGDKITGVTTFFLTHDIDTGDIIEQKSLEISDSDNVGTVHDRLMILGSEMVVDTVKKIAEGTVRTMPQPQGHFTPAPKIFREDCRIIWEQPCDKVRNHIRGLSPYPGAWSIMLDTTGKAFDIKLLSASFCEGPEGKIPGSIICSDGKLKVCCADGWLQIGSLKPSGKRTMEAEAFLRGYSPERFITNAEPI